MPPKFPSRSVPSLGRIVRDARKSRRLSQATVAQAMGVPRTYISKVERGRTHLSVHNLVRIGSAIGYEGWRMLWAAQSADEKEARVA